MTPEQELIECRECGQTFNLAAQWYYDGLCPSCKSDAGEEDKTWPGCVVCDDRIPPDERDYVTVSGAARDPSTVRLPVHEGCKEDHPSTTRRGP